MRPVASPLQARSRQTHESSGLQRVGQLKYRPETHGVLILAIR